MAGYEVIIGFAHSKRLETIYNVVNKRSYNDGERIVYETDDGCQYTISMKNVDYIKENHG